MHTFTYTPDAGKSVAMLGNTASAYNQTWHALTSKEKMSGEDYVRIACEIAGRPYSMQSLRKFGVSMVGIFSPILHEFVEMMYQFENDYVFDSTKFEKAFNTNATAYRDGIAETLK
jgi:nucleoside-diphosphate-sugar epimerase